MTIMTETLLRSELADEFSIVHVDTSDHREIAAVGRVDVRNVVLALRHAAAFLWALVHRRPEVVYIPIARDRLGYLRDAAFLLPARLSRIPVVLHLHSRQFYDFYRGERLLMRTLITATLPRRAIVVVLGESRRDDFGPLVPATQVAVVPNGIVDPGAPCSAAGDRDPIVLHLSTQSRAKGTFSTLEAMRRLRIAVPDARLVLAGGWASVRESEAAAEFLAEHGLGEHVTMLGAVQSVEKARLLEDAAVYCFPSEYPQEGHPLTVIEALAAGTPVVASALAAIPETVTDGVEGFLVPPGDVDLLTERLEQLLRDAQARTRMGAAARARFERDFTIARFSRDLGRVWREAATP
jgi:glycosyltransferase involved in cell wall biosynthesis